MPAFDSAERKIVVRVVFDGPGFAGKTTNVRRLHGFFTDRRRGDLVVPEEREGRTQLFDWMHLDGGLVHGYGLRCQLVTVPGQEILAKRRWRLLRTADVVVFVCDSTPTGLTEASRMFAMLREYLEHRWDGDLPLVVQANKQDLPGAMELSDVRSELGIGQEVPVVPATAETGVGVRETVVLAIRAAANRVQRLLLDQGIEGLSPQPETVTDLTRELQGLQVEAPPSLVVDVPRPAQTTPEAAAPPAWESGQVAPASVASTPPEVTPPEATLRPDVPPGLIWPAATGRDILRRACAAGTPALRSDLSGQNGLAPGSGGGATYVFEAGMWCLKTSLHRYYADLEEGRAALLGLARYKATLGDLLPPNTAVSLHADTGGGHRLWTVCPWLTPLRAQMLHAAEHGDQEALGTALANYAQATVAAVQLAARRGMVLDVHPSNFAAIGERIHYLDDDIDEGFQIPAVGHAILQRVLEYEAYPEAIDHYLKGLLEGVQEKLLPDRHGVAALEDAVSKTPARTDAMRRAQERLVLNLRATAKECTPSPQS
jgi:signal recognition particle receptor subunit beta